MDTTILNNGKVNNPQGKDNTKGKQASSKGQTVKAGLGGAVLGASAAVIIGQLVNDANAAELPHTPETAVNPDAEDKPIDTPVWAVGDLQVAHNINDDMTFDEAFAAAREEVGPGGAFQWHGSVYGTYTASEWNEMSTADRAEFNNHFSWNQVNATSGNVATVQPIEEHHHHHHHTQVEVVEVIETHQPESDHTAQPVNETISYEPEIEVLGVVHDHETGANIGAYTVDSQEVVVIDVDGDLEFDLMASDLNQNNTLDEGEVVDIHGQGLTVDHLGGFTNPADAIEASDDYMASLDDPGMPV